MQPHTATRTHPRSHRPFWGAGGDTAGAVLTAPLQYTVAALADSVGDSASRSAAPYAQIGTQPAVSLAGLYLTPTMPPRVRVDPIWQEASISHRCMARRAMLSSWVVELVTTRWEYWQSYVRTRCESQPTQSEPSRTPRHSSGTSAKNGARVTGG